MSSHESEQVLSLLQELSVLKELGKTSEAGPTEQRLREQRCAEILEEIKTVAQQKKDGLMEPAADWVPRTNEA